MSDKLTVLLHAVFTLGMAGLMLAVQVVIYPQFRSVVPANLEQYVADHSVRIVIALAPLAIPEVVLALWLFVDTPASLSRTIVFASGALLAAAWISTALWYGPLHGRLQANGSASDVELLIRTNWIRSALWWARSGLATWFLWDVFSKR